MVLLSELSDSESVGTQGMVTIHLCGSNRGHPLRSSQSAQQQPLNPKDILREMKDEQKTGF